MMCCSGLGRAAGRGSWLVSLLRLLRMGGLKMVCAWFDGLMAIVGAWIWMRIWMMIAQGFLAGRRRWREGDAGRYARDDGTEYGGNAPGSRGSHRSNGDGRNE